ncbi:similar to An01g09600 [Aspergillus luchuensis IFO 4308]|nr:similar to An01g09600 [Aspergillus luchuensis IFO 4308]
MDSMIKIPGSYPRDHRSSPPIVNKLISNSGAQQSTEFTPQVTTALLSKYDARVSRETARSIFNRQSDTVDMIFECLSGIVGGVWNVVRSIVCALYSGFRDSTSQSAGKDLDHETAAKMLKPILLLLAAYEAAQMYSITTDGEVLNGEITAHAWGHDYGFARTLRRYDDSLVRAEDQFSMTLTYIMATAVLTECICNILQVGSCYGLAVMMACILAVLFAAAEDYVGCSATSTSVEEDREVMLRDVMIGALKKGGIRYAEVRSISASRTHSASDTDVLEKYLIKGLKAPTTGTVHDVYVTHYNHGMVVERFTPEEDTVSPSSPAESSNSDHDGYKVSYGLRYLAEVSPQDQQAIAKGIGRSWTCLDQTSTMILTECDISDEHADFYFDFDARSDDDDVHNEEKGDIEIAGSLNGFL